MSLELILGAGIVVGIALAVWALVKAAAARSTAEALIKMMEEARAIEQARLKIVSEPLGSEAEWLRRYEDDNGVP